MGGINLSGGNGSGNGSGNGGGMVGAAWAGMEEWWGSKWESEMKFARGLQLNWRPLLVSRNVSISYPGVRYPLSKYRIISQHEKLRECHSLV